MTRFVLGQRGRFDGVGLFEGWRFAAKDVRARADLAEGTTHVSFLQALERGGLVR